MWSDVVTEDDRPDARAAQLGDDEVGVDAQRGAGEVEQDEGATADFLRFFLDLG